MYSEDQTFIGKKRLDIIKSNFKLLIAQTEIAGFPNIDYSALPKDSCKTLAVTATLIHIAQTSPESLFNDKIINLFENEIRNVHEMEYVRKIKRCIQL